MRIELPPHPSCVRGHQLLLARQRIAEGARAWVVAWVLSLALLPVGLGLELYVSPDGKDEQPGTLVKPFATLERARDAIRRMKAVSQEPVGEITVYLRAGTYVLTHSFELNESDSGAPNAPISYRAYPGEGVRLLGGVVLRQFAPVADPEVLARLNPEARSRVWQVDLRAQGLTDYGRWQSRGFGRPIAPAAAELYFNGEPMQVARWPNAGQWERIAGFPSGFTDEHGGKLGALTNGYFYAGDRPGRWQKSDQIWVHGYWAYDWANSYERVAALDPARHLIQTAPPQGLYGFREGQRFYFLNVLEELDTPGEYFLDRGAGRLYFWPPKTIESGEVLLSMLESPLIVMDGASHLIFRGLTLECTRGHGVAVHAGQSNLIAGCIIRLTGNYGVLIDGGQAHGVVGCDIEDNGDGGVSVTGGDRQTLTPSGHYVENCHFQRQGRWSRCYVPAVLVNGVGVRVAHNLIHDHPHCAILFAGNDHRLEFNDIHHVALETGDVGAIYAGRDYTYRGNRIRNNFIHETGGVGMGSMGVYMDDCVSGTDISSNVFYKVTRAAFLGGGRDHVVENNIFVECQPAVQLDGRGLDKSPVWHEMVNVFMRQRWQQAPQELYRQRYPALTNLDRYYLSDRGVPPGDNRVIHNVCAGGKWLEVGWHADATMLEARDNWVGDQPGFLALEKLDFRLREDSPAWKVGFKPIPLASIGLEADVYRRELKRVRSKSSR